MSNTTERQVVCENCGGSGKTVVTREMAIDAGIANLAGESTPCGSCDGDGFKFELVPDPAPTSPRQPAEQFLEEFRKTRPRRWIVDDGRVHNYHDEWLIAFAEAYRSASLPPESFKCDAQISRDPPQDCFWPFCGCDENATKVVQTLLECGWDPPRPKAEAVSLPVQQQPPMHCDMCSQPLDAQVEFLNRELANFRRNNAKAAEEREQASNLFWPAKDEFEEHIYEIRNGKTADYVMAHALALAGTFASAAPSTPPASSPEPSDEIDTDQKMWLRQDSCSECDGDGCSKCEPANTTEGK